MQRAIDRSYAYVLRIRGSVQNRLTLTFTKHALSGLKVARPGRELPTTTITRHLSVFTYVRFWLDCLPTINWGMPGEANFVELRKAEVRRIPLPRTPVNRG